MPIIALSVRETLPCIPLCSTKTHQSTLQRGLQQTATERSGNLERAESLLLQGARESIFESVQILIVRSAEQPGRCL